jgi:hypothetical protein
MFNLTVSIETLVYQNSNEIESILCVSKFVGIVEIIWAEPIDFPN